MPFYNALLACDGCQYQDRCSGSDVDDCEYAQAGLTIQQHPEELEDVHTTRPSEIPWLCLSYEFNNLDDALARWLIEANEIPGVLMTPLDQITMRWLKERSANLADRRRKAPKIS